MKKITFTQISVAGGLFALASLVLVFQWVSSNSNILVKQTTDGPSNIAETSVAFPNTVVDSRQESKTPVQDTQTQINEKPLEVMSSPSLAETEAIKSFADSRLNGDDRTPNITPVDDRLDLPNEEQLTQPEQYLSYETDQTKKVYQAFLAAAPEKINRLQESIQEAEAAGMPDHEIEVAREKVRRIQAMSQELQQKINQ
ncbi:hypothetical protein [Litoribacillus peritrichatus]|uniref:Uncharacterized protein n=1 Tax=Litoribacillus peritrichatus TaxID=718191 RepID=A0ABP7MAR1_9GAMM